jgi:LPS sulfotransferase NodH
MYINWRRFVCREPNVTRYVILFIERDGSTFLTSALSIHPEIRAEYEKLSQLRAPAVGAKEQLDWVNAFFSPPPGDTAKALGFKTKLEDVQDLDGFARLLLHQQCRVIHLRRRNVVKAVVSKINARRLYRATGDWNRWQESDRLSPAPIDFEKFALLLQQREEEDQKLNQFVKKLHLRTLPVCYEELLVQREQTLHRVLEFLRVRPLPLKSATLKTTSDNLRDDVLNFDELRSRYAGTKYESMFDEVLVPDRKEVAAPG